MLRDVAHFPNLLEVGEYTIERHDKSFNIEQTKMSFGRITNKIERKKWIYIYADSLNWTTITIQEPKLSSCQLIPKE